MIAFFRNSTHAEVHDDPELLWWITDRPLGFDNMLLRARLTPETADGAAAAAIAKRLNFPEIPLSYIATPGDGFRFAFGSPSLLDLPQGTIPTRTTRVHFDCAGRAFHAEQQA